MPHNGPGPELPGRACLILPLEDRPAAVPALVALYEKVWPDWYGPSGNGSAGIDLTGCLSTGTTLPRGLVAFDRAGTPVGCVCLRDRSPGSDRYPGAWLTGLAVHPEHRCRGIGLALITAAEDRARQLGFPALFTTTGPAERLILARGWERIGAVATGAGDMNIYRHFCRV